MQLLRGGGGGGARGVRGGEERENQEQQQQKSNLQHTNRKNEHVARVRLFCFVLETDAGRSGRGGGGGDSFLHDRSRGNRTSHPYPAGTEHMGCSPTRQTSHAHHARSAMRSSASRTKKVSCILRRTACKADFGTLQVSSCISDKGWELLHLLSSVATSRDSLGGGGGVLICCSP